MAFSRHDRELAPDHEPYWTALYPAPPEEVVPQSSEHYNQTSEGHGELRWLFEQRGEQAVVLGDMAMYYILRDDQPVVLPKATRDTPADLTVEWVAPDLMVLPGYGDTAEWTVYPLYLEGVTPLWVMETASSSTHLADLKEKVPLYEKLRIPELLLFNPRKKRLYPKRLQGLRLNPTTGKYFDVTTPSGEVSSEGLRVTFFLEQRRLRIRDDLTGMIVPTRQDLTLRYQQAEQALRVEAFQRGQAEHALRVEACQRKQAEQARQVEAQRREQAEQALHDETRKRRETEARMAALLEELRRPRADPDA